MALFKKIFLFSSFALERTARAAPPAQSKCIPDAVLHDNLNVLLMFESIKNMYNINVLINLRTEIKKRQEMDTSHTLKVIFTQEKDVVQSL